MSYFKIHGQIFSRLFLDVFLQIFKNSSLLHVPRPEANFRSAWRNKTNAHDSKTKSSRTLLLHGQFSQVFLESMRFYLNKRERSQIVDTANVRPDNEEQQIVDMQNKWADLVQDLLKVNVYVQVPDGKNILLSKHFKMQIYFQCQNISINVNEWQVQLSNDFICYFWKCLWIYSSKLKNTHLFSSLRRGSSNVWGNFSKTGNQTAEIQSTLKPDKREALELDHW